jgi:hypothetical protein
MIALTGGSDDLHAAGDSELHGEGAYPAGGPVDENRLAGLETKSFQHGVCGARLQQAILLPPKRFREACGPDSLVRRARILRMTA